MKKLHVLVLIMSALLVIEGLIILELSKKPKYCEFELCKSRGTLIYCLVIGTDCRVLKNKCTDFEYLAQWDLQCKWGNETCSCEFTPSSAWVELPVTLFG